MTKNKRKQCKATPYLLYVDGKPYGAYQYIHPACEIGRSLMNSEKATSYCVRDLNDTIVGGDYV